MARPVSCASPPHREPPASKAGDRRALLPHPLQRFSRTQSGAHGVEATDFGTGLHHVRYLVPVAADDPATSSAPRWRLTSTRTVTTCSSRRCGRDSSRCSRRGPRASWSPSTWACSGTRTVRRSAWHACARRLRCWRERRTRRPWPLRSREQRLPVPVCCDDVRHPVTVRLRT